MNAKRIAATVFLIAALPLAVPAAEATVPRDGYKIRPAVHPKAESVCRGIVSLWTYASVIRIEMPDVPPHAAFAILENRVESDRRKGETHIGKDDGEQIEHAWEIGRQIAETVRKKFPNDPENREKLAIFILSDALNQCKTQLSKAMYDAEPAFPTLER